MIQLQRDRIDVNKVGFWSALDGDDEDERDPKKTTARGSLSPKI